MAFCCARQGPDGRVCDPTAYKVHVVELNFINTARKVMADCDTITAIRGLFTTWFLMLFGAK